MSGNFKQDFVDLLNTETSNLTFKEVDTRSATDLIYQLLIYGSTIGAFSGLWKVIELWVKRYANATVKITYKTQSDETVNVEYNNLTKKEAEKYLNSHLPRIENPIKVELLKET